MHSDVKDLEHFLTKAPYVIRNQGNIILFFYTINPDRDTQMFINKSTKEM